MPTRTLTLRADAHRRLIEIGLTLGPEICGLLVDLGAGVEAVEVTNRDPRPDRFELDPDETFEILSRDGEVVGAFHSHPGGVAVPSATDHAGAVVDWWLVVSAGGEVRAWWLVADGFDEGRIVTEGQ